MKTYFPRSLILILILLVLLRLPSLFEPYWYLDEAMYLTIGRCLRHGWLLYQDIFDNKPPGIYWLALLSPSLWVFRLIALVSQFVSVFLFFHLTKKIGGRNNIAFLATLLLVLLTATPVWEGNITNAEILMSPFVIGAFYLGWCYLNKSPASAYRWLFGAGLLCGLATLIKAVALFDFFTLLLIILVLRPPANMTYLVSELMVSITGLLLPWLVTIMYFLSKQALGAFVYSTLIYNQGYIEVFSPPLVWGSLSLSWLPKIIIWALFLLALILLKRRLSQLTLVALIWLLATLFAVTLSNRSYPHYLVQVAPSLALTLAVLFSLTKDKVVSIIFTLFFIYVFNLYNFSAVPVWSYYHNFMQFQSKQISVETYQQYFDQRMWRIEQLGNYLKHSVLPNQQILIIGDLPQLYAQSGVLPSGRYLTLFQLQEHLTDADLETYLNKQPPDLIVDLDRDAIKDPKLNHAFDSYIKKNEYQEIPRVADVRLWIK